MYRDLAIFLLKLLLSAHSLQMLLADARLTPYTSPLCQLQVFSYIPTMVPLKSFVIRGVDKGFLGYQPRFADKNTSLKPKLPIKRAVLEFQRRLALMVYWKFAEKLNSY